MADKFKGELMNALLVPIWLQKALFEPDKRVGWFGNILTIKLLSADMLRCHERVQDPPLQWELETSPTP